jgi:hypothetical protein
MQTRITLTREALYEEAWKTPMSRLAAELGISDVALGKICRKLDVPIPGRGYWAHVTNGQKVKRPKLPNARPGAQTEFTITPRERVAAEAIEIPEVKVSDTLAGAHGVIKRLAAVLDGREPGHAKTTYLRGHSEATVRLSKATKRRALLILDALLKAFELRGHVAGLNIPKDRWGEFDLTVKVGDEVVKLFIAEPLKRHDHELTTEEAKQHAQYGWSYAPKYDFESSGRLKLRACASYAMDRSWSDGAKQRLENVLGEVVVTVEELARRATAYHAELEETERRRQEKERRRQIDLVHRNYERALAQELDDAVENLRRADAIRDLLRAAEAAALPEEKSDTIRRWMDWAARWADRLDPRSNPARAARIVDPDVGAMSEEEFNFWRDWPASAKSAYGRTFRPLRV